MRPGLNQVTDDELATWKRLTLPEAGKEIRVSADAVLRLIEEIQRQRLKPPRIKKWCECADCVKRRKELAAERLNTGEQDEHGHRNTVD